MNVWIVGVIGKRNGYKAIQQVAPQGGGMHGMTGLFLVAGGRGVEAGEALAAAGREAAVGAAAALPLQRLLQLWRKVQMKATDAVVAVAPVWRRP